MVYSNCKFQIQVILNMKGYISYPHIKSSIRAYLLVEFLRIYIYEAQT